MTIKSFHMDWVQIDNLLFLTVKELVHIGSLEPNTIDEDCDKSRTLIQWLSNKEESSVLFLFFTNEYLSGLNISYKHGQIVTSSFYATFLMLYYF